MIRVVVYGYELRRCCAAFVDDVAATGMKRASGRWSGRVGHIAGQEDVIGLDFWRWRGNGGHQGFGIGVSGRPIERLVTRQFYDLPQIHDRDPVADVVDDAQIMGDEQIAKVKLVS